MADQLLTPDEVAERMGRGTSRMTVLRRIYAGELIAVNIAAKSAKRPRWRITESAFAAYIKAHTNPLPVRRVA